MSLTGFLSVLTLSIFLSTAAFANDNQYVLEVDGLACPFCAYGIEKKLLSIDAVETIDIDINRGQILVTVAHNDIFNKSIASSAVEDAGFSLRTITKVE